MPLFTALTATASGFCRGMPTVSGMASPGVRPMSPSPTRAAPWRWSTPTTALATSPCTAPWTKLAPLHATAGSAWQASSIPPTSALPAPTRLPRRIRGSLASRPATRAPSWCRMGDRNPFTAPAPSRCLPPIQVATPSCSTWQQVPFRGTKFSGIAPKILNYLKELPLTRVVPSLRTRTGRWLWPRLAARTSATKGPHWPALRRCWEASSPACGCRPIRTGWHWVTPRLVILSWPSTPLST